MPYTRQELLAAVRADHPQLAGIEDNKLFAAIAVDHPDLAKGISELQAPAPPQPIPGDSVLGPLLGGVGPSAFGQRIAGAAASVINPLFPGGDTPRPQGMPAMTPEQDIGAKAVTMGTVVDPLARAVANRIPTLAGAGAKFRTVESAAKNVPLDLTQPDQLAARANELGERGSTLPKVLRDYMSHRDVNLGMTYGVGRDFATNAGALSGSERLAMNPPMERVAGQFAAALKDANREAAIQVGMGDLYDSAMKEYRQAKTLGDAAAIVKKYAVRAGIGAALGGAGTAAGVNIYHRLMR